MRGYFIYLVSSVLVIAVSFKRFEPMTGLAMPMANLPRELKSYFWTASRLLILAVAIISMPSWQLTMRRDELSLQGRLYQLFQETLHALQETTLGTSFEVTAVPNAIFKVISAFVQNQLSEG